MEANKKRIKNYFMNREKDNKTQEEAEVLAYGKNNKHGGRIEQTKTYEGLKEKYADVLKEKITFDDLADIQIRNAKQEKDKGASNKAIESIVNKLEPENTELDTGDVIVKIKK